MARRTSRRRSHTEPPTFAVPSGPVAVATGTVEAVVDRDDPLGVTLHVNGVPSSYVHADPTVLTFEYMEHMAALLDALEPGPLRALHVGAAGCTLPRWIDARRPGSRQVAIDPDPVLLELVREWFTLPRSPALRLRAADGRTAIASAPPESSDVIIRDAFAGATTPEHLTTDGWSREVLRVLRPGGLYLANIADRAPLRLARAEVATALAGLATAPDDSGTTTGPRWSRVVLVAEPAVLKGRRYGNLVLAAVRAGGTSIDLTGAQVDRALRRLAVPAHIVADNELERFAAGAGPLRDPVAPEDVAKDDPPVGHTPGPVTRSGDDTTGG
ncbi:spermidine synthase [Sanguibacter sp. A247]|uniref:spermidine synthase n=1 Tax=unclassified Sanguibacter TaxID=2645534 RepID=UPI003FD6C987